MEGETMTEAATLDALVARYVMEWTIYEYRSRDIHDDHTFDVVFRKAERREETYVSVESNEDIRAHDERENGYEGLSVNKYQGEEPADWDGHWDRYWDEQWSPSLDISAAWEVVEKIGPARIERFSDGWYVAFGRLQEDRVLALDTEVAETAPLAICLAALKAVGAETPA